MVKLLVRGLERKVLVFGKIHAHLLVLQQKWALHVSGALAVRGEGRLAVAIGSAMGSGGSPAAGPENRGSGGRR